MRDVFDENRSRLLYICSNMMNAIAQKHPRRFDFSGEELTECTWNLMRRDFFVAGCAQAALRGVGCRKAR